VTAGGAAPSARPLVDIRLESLATRPPPEPALHDVSVHVRYGEFFTFLGPPHAGKSAVLRAVAGFQPLLAGRVIVDGEDIAAVPAGRRGIGVVFAGGALWPHLTVRQHVVFGLAGADAGEAERRLTTVLGRLGLADAAGRRPADLTPDQRRRLALARALVVEPRVLLLDEPLAHLDPIPRKTLRLELARLHRDLAVTTVCATRDAADALALSDRLAVMREGRVLQVGEPEQVYRRPASRAVAEALGPANFVAVEVVEVRELGVVVQTGAGDQVPVAGVGDFREGSRGMLVLRPDTLSLVDASMARGPGLPGAVSMRVFEGGRYVYEVSVGAGVTVRVETAAADAALFRIGDRVRIQISADTVVLLPT
jgi:ABC-type Fe3+/spermidine/putrescine transport system ATPase subunit